MSVVVADTHAVVWYLAGSSRLSDTARDTMRDAAANGAILVSAISLIEIVYLTESGRLPAAALERIEERLADAEAPFELVPIDAGVVDAVKKVPRDHVPDMPDRIIAATAVVLGLDLVTADSRLLETPAVQTIW
jgi:PIN domain nuclease of toxin-antitoxin system